MNGEYYTRVAARFLEVKILTFPDFFLTIFELFPDFKINKFLARNWVLLETRPYILHVFSQKRILEHFFLIKTQWTFSDPFDSLHTVL